jgi:hypothetical protein
VETRDSSRKSGRRRSWRNCWRYCKVITHAILTMTSHWATRIVSRRIMDARRTRGKWA